MTMTAQPWDVLTTELRDEEPGEVGPRLRKQPSPIGQLLGQNMLDDAVRALQEDLALLQAGQERGISALGSAMARLIEELGEVRSRIGALGELGNSSAATPAAEAEWAALLTRVDRSERQVMLLLRGMETLDGLRHQVSIHTQAIGRLTDLVAIASQPRPIEGLEALQQTVALLQQSQAGQQRFQVLSLAVAALGALPGVGALVWLAVRVYGG
ncbi:MAG: hypothetical protein IT307_01960 [Chloroflexi bacterium]|nr:hypothetical protein [Chloroflexota bacterium]